MSVFTRLSAFFAALGAAAFALAGQGRYLERDEFLSSAFASAVPERATIWLTEELRGSVERALGHAYPVLRLTYWRAGERTAWVLDEIGKEQPITVGVIVNADAVESVRILEFRESRGFEVRYPFFTDQFNGARLRSAIELDKHVDGITGATLSVRAVDRAVKLALLLHERALHPAS